MLPRPQSVPVWRDLSLAVVVGLLGYALSCWLVAPGTVPSGFGIDWQLVSERPQDLPGRLPHRLLAPVVAWACGCGGANYLVFVRGLSVFLLATVFFFCRRRGASVLDGALVTLAVAVTAPVQMYKEHWVGYPDAVCYGLFLWMLIAAKQPAVFWSLFFVNLLNHELAAFLLPWLWFVRREAGGSWRADALGAGLALAVYAAFYLWVKAVAPQQLFDANYFLGHPLFPGGTVAVWGLALTHLVVAFGPVLAVLAWHQHVREHGRERLHLWAVGAGVVVIFCIAFDWARHSNLVVIPLVLASLRFLQAGHRLAYGALVALGVGLMVWIPPWSPSAWPTDRMANPTLLVSSGLVVLPPPGAEANSLNITFGPLSATLNNWLPQVWPVLATITAIAAAIWLTGAALAWRQRTRTA